MEHTAEAAEEEDEDAPVRMAVPARPLLLRTSWPPAQPLELWAPEAVLALLALAALLLAPSEARSDGSRGSSGTDSHTTTNAARHTAPKATGLAFISLVSRCLALWLMYKKWELLTL